MSTNLKRLLRQARGHCPPALQKKIDLAIGPQPEETMGVDSLRECLIESVDARDFDDAVGFALRLESLQDQSTND